MRREKLGDSKAKILLFSSSKLEIFNAASVSFSPSNRIGIITCCYVWLGVGFIALTVGACSVNNQLATQDSTLSQGSSHYHNGKFHNDDIMEANGFGKILGLIGRYITEEKKHAVPDQPLPMKAVSTEQLQALSNDHIYMVKLGHSSILLKVYGEFWLLDPVFSERASPFSFLGPKRFQQTPISIDELPEIDKYLFHITITIT